MNMQEERVDLNQKLFTFFPLTFRIIHVNLQNNTFYSLFMRRITIVLVLLVCVMTALSGKKKQKIADITSQLDDKDKELKESNDNLLSSTARINELKEIVDRKNKDIDDHKQLLYEKNEELEKLKDLQPRIRSLELEKADLKSDYEKQITSLKADLEKAELMKDDIEKLDQEISRLNEVVDDKDVQLNDMAKFKDYFLAMISKPLPGLTSFQSQIYHLLPDAKSASELYDYLMDHLNQLDLYHLFL